MTAYAAFLRAVNVGGTGKLAMSELVRLCEAAGLQDVKTYIQSGNVVFRSRLSEAAIQKKLEAALTKQLGKSAAVLLRTDEELAKILASNPFPKAAPNQVLVLFLADAPPKSPLADLKIPGREQVVLAGREVFIHYPDGMGRSKLRLPIQETGTGRNLNTVRKVFDLCRAISSSA